MQNGKHLLVLGSHVWVSLQIEYICFFGLLDKQKKQLSGLTLGSKDRYISLFSLMLLELYINNEVNIWLINHT